MLFMLCQLCPENLILSKYVQIESGVLILRLKPRVSVSGTEGLKYHVVVYPQVIGPASMGSSF